MDGWSLAHSAKMRKRCGSAGLRDDEAKAVREPNHQRDEMVDGSKKDKVWMEEGKEGSLLPIVPCYFLSFT